jgi:hypothetical protein
MRFDASLSVRTRKVRNISRVYVKVLHNIEWIWIKFRVGFFWFVCLFFCFGFAVPDLVTGHQMKICNQRDKDISGRYNNISYLGC